MGLRLRGFDAEKVHADLVRIFQPAKTRGVQLADLASVIADRYAVAAHAGRNTELEAVLEFVRHSALVLGVNASVLYGGAPSAHAVYVGSAEVATDPLPDVVRSWKPSLHFVPSVEIVDPERTVQGRREWPFEDLESAYRGEFLAISLRRS